MRTLNQSEISRTAFKAQEHWNSPFGYTHPNRDKNEMCPYCKNEDTDVVRDEAHLNAFRQWYGDKVKKFTAVHCPCCSAVWSFYEPK
jgi:hypothetical protein